MKVLGIFATFLVALMLAACGGGGGGSSSTPTTTQPTPAPSGDSTKPVLTLVTSSPMSVTGAVVIASDKDLLGNPQVMIRYGYIKLIISGPTTLNQGNRSMSWKPLGASLPCNAVLDGTAIGTDTNGNASEPLNFTITTAACPTDWWPPKNLAPIGQNVVGMNVLSGEEVLIGDLTWQAAVKDGTIKFVDTGMVTTGIVSGTDTQPLVFGIVKYENAWCFIPVHKSDGSPIGTWVNADRHCNSTEFNSFRGSANGLIRYFPGSNQCYEIFWNASESRDYDRQVPCPQ